MYESAFTFFIILTPYKKASADERGLYIASEQLIAITNK